LSALCSSIADRPRRPDSLVSRRRASDGAPPGSPANLACRCTGRFITGCWFPTMTRLYLAPILPL
jgi:hypothetical protein